MITQCIEERPNLRTLWLGEYPINLSRLCEKTGITLSHLSYIIKGKREPSLRFMRILAHALGTTLDFLDKTLQDQKRKNKFTRPDRCVI